MRVAARALSLMLSGVLLGGAVFAQAEDEAYGDDYQAGDYGRIRYEENGVTILRSNGERGAAIEERATTNAPIFPGDTVQTGRDQRAEVQLASASLVRLDRDTELVFLALPSPYQSYRDNTVLQLVEGTVRISARLADDQEFRVDTPASSVYLLDDGDFRVETTSSGATVVHSWRGVAEVAGDGGSVLVRAGMQAEIFPGSVPEDPRPFNTFAYDSFDRWVSEREGAYRVQRDYGYGGDDDYSGVDVYRSLPYEVRPYYGELSYSGRWVYVRNYGYCWYPYGVSVGWRPYYHGYWKYGSHGYFWVSREPWGWAPYHYGRWSWVPGYGWCWVPGRVFGGAWVSWSWGSAHIGWAPLDYWNRPAYIGTIHYGYYDPRCWTFVSYRHFGHHHPHDHAVSVRKIGHDLRRYAVVTRAPRVSPDQLASDPQVRTRAFNEASGDVQARLRKIDRTRAPGRRFIETEDRLAKRFRDIGGFEPTDTRVERPTTRIRSETGAPTRPVKPTLRRPATRSAGAGQPVGPKAEGPSPRNPRRMSPGSGATRTPTRAAPSSKQGSSRPRGGIVRSERRPRQEASREREARSSGTGSRLNNSRRDTRERLRDLYRRMARPRETRERPKKPSSGDSSGSSASSRPTVPRGSSSRAVERPRSSSVPRARPNSRSRTSPRAAPNRPVRQPRSSVRRPSASPRSGRSSSAAPQAAPRVRAGQSKARVSKPSSSSGSKASSGSKRAGSTRKPKKKD